MLDHHARIFVHGDYLTLFIYATTFLFVTKIRHVEGFEPVVFELLL